MDMSRSQELHIMNKIAENIGANYRQFQDFPITGFMSMVGCSYKRDLMVVGRAVNGWSKGWQPKLLSDAKNRISFAKGAFESVTQPSPIGNPCPMRWVSDCWGNYDHEYNTRKSAFWRVIRSVISELEIADVDSPEWPSHLVWSNLYKVAPADGGNPSNVLCSLQVEGCCSLLQEELRVYKPKRLLFLTGFGWAQPFLENFGSVKTVDSTYQYVEAIGKSIIEGDETISIVVASHPQGKSESLWIQEVVDAFKVIK